MGSEKVRGSNQLRRVCNACTSHPIAIEDDMKQPASTFVFHEQEVAGVAFRAMVETGRVVLQMQNSSGRESSVDLIARHSPCRVSATPKMAGSVAA
ncbi:hypothetical protein BRDID11004_69620 [Bradyrhizobium diazoefficiens]|jgi:deoxyinosine 3'endonuclease (endonuclease V)|uniref:Uncharacterized protein n=6 Tax=Bradyrhizobium TaxID=374 RepID=A0A809Z401_9BRAD|nr:hypothetical protein AAV28_05200 [Bradyrhizobium diazoefficiens USDA 110]APG15342.1 hypothetical protein BKD09_44335 [Bradyrhizobium japonicum]APO50273.1 hypothetical protein BD122_08520 [Bradyrhizobium diazoefficiens]KGJ67603.1 hypothetical protein BJA5080_07549 [Bradyrhizobium diazoefficiens SEMIA 5080]QBP20567.1 hypothetical protein Bdiaspc4_08400 [Bradyrhizobium diazoefficiens]